MSLLFSKGRELFEKDYRSSSDGQAAARAKGYQRTKSGKVLFSMRKQNTKRR